MRTSVTRKPRHHRALSVARGASDNGVALASARKAAMASSSLRRCPTNPTPSSFKSSAVKLGRTVSSILFSRNDASYYSRPSLRSQPPRSMMAPSTAYRTSPAQFAAAQPITSFPFCRPHYTYTATILVSRTVLFVALVATPAFCKACGQDDLFTVVISKGRMAVGRGGGMAERPLLQAVSDGALGKVVTPGSHSV
jgi:hypothetical protein